MFDPHDFTRELIQKRSEEGFTGSGIITLEEE
jgi:hypothetical protein